VRILVADDESVSRRILQSMLEDWGYSVRVCTDGGVAWELLQQTDAPPLVILDWVMPRMNGLEVCRKLRAVSKPCPTYVVLVTSKDQNADIVTGLDAGADDYVAKPFNREELRARVQVGERVVELQRRLAERVRELEAALADVKHLSGLLPICAYCKKIRNDQNYWQQVEIYVSEHSEAQFSHGICPDCYETVVKTELSHLHINES
jgi:phosphoserine phosphatase RsbU/P